MADKPIREQSALELLETHAKALEEDNARLRDGLRRARDACLEVGAPITASCIDELLESSPVETAASPGPMPDWAQLLLECRDALPAISLSAARLHGLDLTLADRIERMLEPWRVADDEPARYPAPSPDRKPQESKRE